MAHSDGLDIAVVLPGSASLGAYQAGAAAALIAGRHELRRRGRDIQLPAWGGASAGATIALLAAHSLAHGLDPVKVFRDAWVDGVGLEVLTTGKRSPLGHSGLRSSLQRLMVEGRAHHVARPPTEPANVAVHVALTTLRGYRYQLDDLGEHPADAVTYADWSQFCYRAGGDPARLFAAEPSAPIDVVMASVANPVAFPPVLLDRSTAISEYAARGLEDASSGSEAWWFTDGGLVQSRPIHRTLGMLPESSRGLRCAVIDPRSEGPSTGTAWSDPHRAADWIGSIVRAMSIFPVQILSDELRRIDRENRMRRRLEELAGLLAAEDPEKLQRWAAENGVSGVADPVLAALHAAVDLESTRPVSADVIHPRLVVEDGYVPQLLAGELLGDFAGFLSRELRESDFALGFAAGKRWWEIILPEHHWEPELAAVRDHLDATGPPPWRPVNRGATTLSDLPWRARFGLAKVAARAIRALFRRR